MKRGRGHVCWSCRQGKPNEAFSGGNHGRHLCRACASQRRRAAREAMSFRSPAPPAVAVAVNTRPELAHVVKDDEPVAMRASRRRAAPRALR